MEMSDGAKKDAGEFACQLRFVSGRVLSVTDVMYPKWCNFVVKK